MIRLPESEVRWTIDEPTTQVGAEANVVAFARAAAAVLIANRKQREASEPICESQDQKQRNITNGK